MSRCPVAPTRRSAPSLRPVALSGRTRVVATCFGATGNRPGRPGKSDAASRRKFPYESRGETEQR